MEGLLSTGLTPSSYYYYYYLNHNFLKKNSNSNLTPASGIEGFTPWIAPHAAVLLRVFHYAEWRILGRVPERER